MTKLFTAAEIAGMRLPDLPTTKKAILTRAEKEAWPYETKIGLGGARKVFAIPSRYLPEDEAARLGAAPSPLIEGRGHTQASTEKVAGTISSGTRADPELLSLAVRALEEWSLENQVQIDPARKGAIIAVLYDYLQKGAGQGEVENLLRVMKG
ncbi:hypothetical protein [Massilia sp. NR 4-1]|uniref:hypothetical protein n=1 Tax=Massilia sp. NR 4-1 TaxID=1678028 RepID=UPI00067E026D|nr:hypothetical protein [Massilia sp. NR 4-1]